MKKMTTIWMMIFMLSMSIPAMATMSLSKMRQNSRFLTDRMTYELGLTMVQYDDIYEVNYDFLNNIRYIMDDVVRGYEYAVDRYYYYLDIRNDDLRWILSDSQYRRFMNVDYFYRPIYTTSNSWLFRIFRVYTDKNHFYYDKPKHYKTYKGEHCRDRNQNVSYYKTNRKEQYNHSVYQGDTKVNRNTRTSTKQLQTTTNQSDASSKRTNTTATQQKESKQRTQSTQQSTSSTRKQSEVKSSTRSSSSFSTSKSERRSTRSSSGSRGTRK